MRIGELSQRTGVSVRLLRYYESQDLIRPERLPNGYRAFAEDDVRLVSRIRTLLTAGLCTKMIARVLPSLCEDDGLLVPCTPQLADELRRERALVDGRIAELLESRRVLDQVIGAAPGGRPGHRS